MSRAKTRYYFEVTIDRSRLSNILRKGFLCDVNQFGRDLFSSWEQRFAGDTKKEIYETFYNRILRDLLRELRGAIDESVFPRLAGFDRELENLY